ncbi:MAG: hypothetical protein EOP48_08320 [Sphingobacteriales bacterium]|nr:MAG: hypothetical protein EOP48_08320 [Sphingobacteriales bacterium]
MKLKFTMIRTALFAGMLILAVTARSQNEVGDLFKSGPADASKLVNAYLNPLFKGLGSGLNSGWSHTAKTKGTLRFEIRISAAGALVPTEGRSYNVNDLGLTNIRPVNPSASTGPTAFGDDTQGSLMGIYSSSSPTPNVPVSTFNLPEGLGFHIVPTPQIQLTMGLPKNIDVMLRLVPKIKIDDDGGKVGMFGIGAKVELLPILMGKAEKKLPFDLAVELGYSQINFDLPLDVNNGANTNQRIESTFKGFHADAIISKKLLFFTPFASVGYQSASTNLAALGTYTFDTPNGSQNFTDPVLFEQ